MLSLVTCTPSPGNIGSQRKVELWWQGGGGSVKEGGRVTHPLKSRASKMGEERKGREEPIYDNDIFILYINL